ncbi:FBD-associated F-box protein At3g52670 [Linum perenne]
MSNHRKKSAARSDDLISELPDEILLSILWRLSSSREAAMTTVLSKRWRSAWRSYPFVEFDFRDLNGSGEADEISSTAVMAHLRQFADATFDRFSRDKFLLMKTLELVLEKGDSAICSSVVNQLLNLAAERKAVVILIKVISRSHRLSLPLGLLSNSTVKSLRLTGINFTGGRLPVNLNALRFLYLDFVELEDAEILENLIASSPVLETLILRHISKFRKLQICNITSSLKTLKVSFCSYLDEIEIAAAGLQTLYLRGLDLVSRIELIAPQLAVLKMIDFQLMGDCILALPPNLCCAASSSWHSSASSSFYYFSKLVVSSSLDFSAVRIPPQLETGLKEIEFDSMPGLEKFFLHFYGRVPDEIKIFQIGSAYTAATNEWKADFCMSNDEDPTYPWFVGLKNFVTTFTQFDTVKIHWHRSGKITFEEANNVHPRAIDHLKIDSDLSTSNEQRVLLDGLFWACRPRFLTFIHCDYNGSEKLTEVFSDLTSKYLLQRFSEDGGEGFNGDRSWLHQLKDVKMIMQLKDVTTIMRDTKMVKNYLRQEGEWEYVGDNAVQTCFELTWNNAGHARIRKETKNTTDFKIKFMVHADVPFCPNRNTACTIRNHTLQIHSASIKGAAVDLDSNGGVDLDSNGGVDLDSNGGVDLDSNGGGRSGFKRRWWICIRTAVVDLESNGGGGSGIERRWMIWIRAAAASLDTSGDGLDTSSINGALRHGSGDD